MMMPPSAVSFEDLPLVEQAHWLRRHEPGKAVAVDLTRSDGTACARMFYDAAGARGTMDPATRDALYQWAAMIDEWRRPADPRRTATP